ncbi:hypothetical protein [Raineyella sp. LH-20]|uniref:hypothetical protein n=1 Tax=Raineyella sp. LH-20 TaxID=3081204 RepID=UPI002952F9E5|nr:hypothetical protein [Raineyella sp. LH-20]WOP17680.1 hypothetical protein R0146_10465 [Raineyella sp. LH-20]
MASRRVCGLMVAWVMVGAAGLLAGCGGGPGVAPSPTPSYSCTPDPGGAPCTPELAAAQAEEAKAYEEAIFVYQEFTKERSRVAMAGGSPTPTPTMERLASGSYLEIISSFLASDYSEGVSSSRPVEIVYVHGMNYSGDSLQLKVCEDGTKIENLDRQGHSLGMGSKGVILLDLSRMEGQWVIVRGISLEGESCM